MSMVAAFTAEAGNSVMVTHPDSVVISFPESASYVTIEEAAEAARAFHRATGICILILKGGASVHVVRGDAA